MAEFPNRPRPRQALSRRSHPYGASVLYCLINPPDDLSSLYGKPGSHGPTVSMREVSGESLAGKSGDAIMWRTPRAQQVTLSGIMYSTVILAHWNGSIWKGFQLSCLPWNASFSAVTFDNDSSSFPVEVRGSPCVKGGMTLERVSNDRTARHTYITVFHGAPHLVLPVRLPFVLFFPGSIRPA